MAQSQARWSVVLILLLAGVCTASLPPQRPGPHVKPRGASDADWTPPFTEHGSCPAMLPPKPLATPLPAFPKVGHGNLKIRFVIGTDGRLHKLGVVNSAGPAADSKAFNALRQWRYEPATCNGVPTEAEGTVEFPAMAH
jgi:TonB family protein